MNNFNIFEEIYNRNIKHTTFIDKDSIIKCMNESYILGFKDGQSNDVSNRGHIVLGSDHEVKK